MRSRHLKTRRSALGTGFGNRKARPVIVLLAIGIAFTGAVLAAPATRPYRIGVLYSRQFFRTGLDGLREGLAQLGYHEGKEVTFLIEDAQGEVDNLPGLASKLVAAKPDLLFTATTGPTLAAQQATATIPIVFISVADPQGSGLIANYSSSHNNLTGVTNYSGPLSGKRLELLREIAPGIKRVLALVAPEERVSTLSFQALTETAPKLGLELVRRDVSTRGEIVQTLEAIPTGAVDAIFFVPSILVGTHIDLLISKAKADRMPLSVSEYPMVEQGALMTYGADLRLIGMQAAKLVVKILSGTKPAELHIQTPEQLSLSINMATAKAIGLDIPRNILERADRLVE